MIAVVVPFLGTRCIDPILREHFFGANGHLNELTYAACFLFRAPHGPNLLMICNNMLARDNNHQTTLAYVERIVDRIINKGRGMLTFNAGLIALSTALFKLSTGDGNPGSLAKQIGSASFASATAPSHPVMIALQTVVLIDLCISSILMLEMFVVRWGPAESYKDAAKECSYALMLCRDRSIIMNFAIFLSAICVFGLLDEVIPYPTN